MTRFHGLLCMLGLVLLSAPSSVADGEEPPRAGADGRPEAGEDGEGDRAQRSRPGGARRRGPGLFLFRILDRDGDRKVTPEEVRAFFREADADTDGALEPEEIGSALRRFRDRLRRGRGTGDRRREGAPARRPEPEGRRERSEEHGDAARQGAVEKDPASLAAARALREARKREDLPGVGDAAPDFRLKLLDASRRPEDVALDEGGRVRLSDYRGKKPVVLIFGSYT